MPEITLSLPSAIGLLALFLTIGAVSVYYALLSRPEVVVPLTETATSTVTHTATLTPTQAPPTETPTPEPSPTPSSYQVIAGDTCLDIAAFFDVSLQSIVQLNNLSADCTNLSVGTILLIPQPTPTATAQPSATLSEAESTRQACETISYVVQDNDTLSSISSTYGVPAASIRDYNGLTSDVVFVGIPLTIPLCERAAPAGPTPTPTLPPPYPAPNLLRPPDGAPFTLADEAITLQWASVGTLRDNEAYMVIVEDVTEGQNRRLVNTVTDTKFVIPEDFRPRESTPHLFQWSVVTVRQSGVNREGNPIWEPTGAASVTRGFIWTGSAAPSTPSP